MRIKSFTQVEKLVFVILMLLVFIMAARTPVDSDMWWHLRSGEVTWDTQSPLQKDIFSFTRWGEPWTNHSWLAQVGMYLLYRWDGYLAITAAMAGLAVFSMGFVYLQLEGPVILKAVFMVLGSLVCAVVWSPRPQLISLCFTALVLYRLYLFKQGHRKGLWVLIPLFILWSNFHGGYSLGLMVIGLTILGEGLNHIFQPESENLEWSDIWQLTLWGAASGAATLINPNGINTWLVEFQTVGVQALQDYIMEWASPDFHDISQQPFLWILFLLVAAFGLSKKKVNFSELFLVIWFGYLALLARRNFGPFALVSVPVLSRYLPGVFNDLGKKLGLRLKGRPLWEKLKNFGVRLNQQDTHQHLVLKKVINLSIVAVLGLVAIIKLYAVSQPVLIDQQLSKEYPVSAINWMMENNSTGNILNEYNWGGYLIWELRGCKVFVDGRTDMYGDEVIGEWVDLVNGFGNWEELLAERSVDYVLLQEKRPLIPLLEEKGWKVLYRDHQTVLLGRKDS